MRMMLTAEMSLEQGNALIVSGKLAETMEAVLHDLKPEAVYFIAKNGNRTMVAIVHMDDASQLPGIAEPLFLGLHAKVEAIPAMTPDDLMKAGPSIEAAVKKHAR